MTRHRSLLLRLLAVPCLGMLMLLDMCGGGGPPVRRDDAGRTDASAGVTIVKVERAPA